MTQPEGMDEGRFLPLVEDFYTLQGEGHHTGKAAYFIRLGGCDVGCRWCDSKLSWNPAVHPLVDVDLIVERAASHPAKAVVITGGEPLSYPLGKLTAALKRAGMEIFLETSGCHPLSGTFDWVCLSPKPQQPPELEVLLAADELKVIIHSMEDLQWAEQCASQVSAGCLLLLQPEWSRYEEMIDPIVEYIKANPKWRISIQAHKFMRIP